jgi:hypothetical protein
LTRRVWLPSFFAMSLLASFEVAATETTNPRAPATAVDLDGDGVAETRVSVSACAGDPNSACLSVEPNGKPPRSIRLGNAQVFDDRAHTDQHLRGAPFEPIGNYTGGPAQELAVLYGEVDGALYHAVLAVVDVEQQRVIARVTSPIGIFNAYVDAARSPGGRLVPFLAPSYGASPIAAPETGAPAGRWDYLCAFDITAKGDSRCGAGFVTIDLETAPTAENRNGYFREVGGYLQDLDGDGWDDINLIYHSHVRAVSIRKRRVISVVQYDIARDSATINRAANEKYPALFHSGRNFGTHSAVRTSSGNARTIIVAGAPVDALGRSMPGNPPVPGDFHDLYCNVSRFVAVIESERDQPATRKLAWARYFGFHSSILNVPPQTKQSVDAVMPLLATLRPGDFMNHCIHRFSDSRVRVDQHDAVGVDIFEAANPKVACQAEQSQLYTDGWSAGFARPPKVADADAKPWSPVKSRAWNECLRETVHALGRWSFETYDETTGKPLRTLRDSYVWGWSDKVLPMGTAFIVEPLPPRSLFDFTWDFDRNAPKSSSGMLVQTLGRGGWTTLFHTPAGVRPAIQHVQPRGARGSGDYTFFTELVTKDIDHDGLLEIQFRDGSWFGYDARTRTFACKLACGPSQGSHEVKGPAPTAPPR